MDKSETTPVESVDNSVENPEETSVDKPVDKAGESQVKSDENFIKGNENQEIGGPKGPEPTRFGDWERNGRCSDF